MTSVELSDLCVKEAAPFDDLDGGVDYLLNEEDSALAAEMLEPNSSAGVLVFANAWATRLRDAIAIAGGRLVESGPQPRRGR